MTVRSEEGIHGVRLIILVSKCFSQLSAITKYRDWVTSKHSHMFLTGWKSQIRMSLWPQFWGGLLAGCRQLPACCVFNGWRSQGALCGLFCNGADPILEGSTPMSSHGPHLQIPSRGDYDFDISFMKERKHSIRNFVLFEL